MKRTSRCGHQEDERSYLVAAQMLKALGVTDIALLSNDPGKARRRSAAARRGHIVDRRAAHR